MHRAHHGLVAALTWLACLTSGPALMGGEPSTQAPRRQAGDALPPVHDPSTIVSSQGQYWLFATGMGVRSLRSKDLMQWQAGPPVFTQLPSWIRAEVPAHRGSLWAPDVIRVGDRYLLYYSVSSWGKNTSAIGLASTASLDPADPDYRWKDEGVVIRSQASDNFNAIDPNVALDAEGRLWLAFGSFWSGIKLVQLDPATGRRVATNSPIYSLAHKESIEAPCLHRHRNFYYLFVNWGLCCRGTNSTYEIRVGRSPAITGPYVDREGTDLLRGGGTLVLASEGAFIGPGHAGILSIGGEDRLSFHYYDGRRKGRAALAIRKLRWTDDGWPAVEQDQSPK